MMYSLYTNNGYIMSIVNDENGTVTPDEYSKLKTIMDSRPTAPEGCYYRLKTDLQWELCQLPPTNVEKIE